MLTDKTIQKAEAIHMSKDISPMNRYKPIYTVTTGEYGLSSKHMVYPCFQNLRVALSENSIWRPVSGQVGDAPLAFCDYHTIDKEDLVPTDRPWNGIVAREIYNLKYSPKQKWYWVRDQVPDEATLFVNWDSNPGEGSAECKY